jgi:hypothetical protein
MRKRTQAVVSILLVAGLALPASPAGAVNEYLCDSVPPSGFEDVTGNPFEAYIDCLVYYGVTSGTGPNTYTPAAAVERWQMAIFLQNLWAALAIIPLSGNDQGFNDLDGLDADAETAINQTAQLSITTGVAPGLFGPFEAVSRWQMALFLARFAAAAGVRLPTPAPSGFTDISGLSTEAQNAISIVKTLGITTGTSATTYSPNASVTRDQMAAFLVRTLQAAWFLATSDFTESCVPDSEGVERCTGSGSYLAGVPLRFRHGWFIELPADTADIDAPNTTITFLIDGDVQVATEISLTVSGARYRRWEVALTQGLSGTHQLESRYFLAGDLVAVDTVTVTFD